MPSIRSLLVEFWLLLAAVRAQQTDSTSGTSTQRAEFTQPTSTLRPAPDFALLHDPIPATPPAPPQPAPPMAPAPVAPVPVAPAPVPVAPAGACYCCANPCALSPRSGEWSEWSAWSACQDYNGVSSQTRLRACIGGNCAGGEYEQARACLSAQPDAQTPFRDAVSPTWSEWSQWSTCSKSCGADNFRTRARHCDCGNAECECAGERVQRDECPTLPCCQYSAWSAWSRCSAASCGADGLRQRVRACSCDAAAECAWLGAAAEQQPCRGDAACDAAAAAAACPACANALCQYCPPEHAAPCHTCLDRGKRRAIWPGF